MAIEKGRRAISPGGPDAAAVQKDEISGSPGVDRAAGGATVPCTHGKSQIAAGDPVPSRLPPVFSTAVTLWVWLSVPEQSERWRRRG